MTISPSNNNPKAVIFGCEGESLTRQEQDFFNRVQPLGFILFSRNCKSPPQIRQLISQLRACVSHADVPILIDQEGGRVARLRPPHWRDYPPSSVFGELFEKNPEEALWAAKVNSFILAQELRDLGITVNCAPVGDLYISKSHPIISDRSFSQDPQVVSDLCLAAMEGFKIGGITPVLKHLPGHGRAEVDSHEDLPIVNHSAEELAQTDFFAFQKICAHSAFDSSSYWGMTAHIIFSKIDSLCATQSPLVISSIIREHIGFKGFLISDCLTMKALCGSYGQRTRDALNAGCDAVLHCSGKLDEMVQMVSDLPPLSCECMALLRQSSRRFQEQDFLLTTPLPLLERQLRRLLKPYWSSADLPTEN